ncbi:hypothetical protein BDZ91DRAFT_766352 [Kalaharituber pfeilii]|nr:hypothetical protein BDZ91DRAFT_766352 [Kalaharituber pfeilii]
MRAPLGLAPGGRRAPAELSTGRRRVTGQGARATKAPSGLTSAQWPRARSKQGTGKEQASRAGAGTGGPVVVRDCARGSQRPRAPAPVSPYVMLAGRAAGASRSQAAVSSRGGMERHDAFLWPTGSHDTLRPFPSVEATTPGSLCGHHELEQMAGLATVIALGPSTPPPLLQSSRLPRLWMPALSTPGAIASQKFLGDCHSAMPALPSSSEGRRVPFLFFSLSREVVNYPCIGSIRNLAGRGGLAWEGLPGAICTNVITPPPTRTAQASTSDGQDEQKRGKEKKLLRCQSHLIAKYDTSDTFAHAACP